MGVEIVQSDLAYVSAENGVEEKSSLVLEKENGKMNQGSGLSEPIKFGSHDADEPVKGEVNHVPEDNFPKDAVDEWPAPKRIHSFYLAKYRSYDDQKLKAKLDFADKELQKKNQARSQITEKLRAKRADRAQVIAQLKSFTAENKQFRAIMDEKRKEMEPLQQALGKLRSANNVGRERGSSLCSSEEELNDLIKSLQYRIQHESIPLTEEKQILREIKQLEGTREKVIANAAMRAKIQDSLGEKEVIQDQVKLIGVDMDGVRKEHQVLKAKLKQLEEEKEAIEREINALQDELTIVSEKRDKAFQNIQELKKQREEGNACFYQNRTLLIKARELSAKKGVEALVELSGMEFEKFMSLWKSSSAFRDDYVKRIVTSLDIRQLSKDGRIRNPNEKPLVFTEASTPTEKVVVAKTNVKQPKEDSIPPLQDNTSAIRKLHKEKDSKHQKDANNKLKGSESTLERIDLEDKGDLSVSEKLQKETPPKGIEVDEVKLKEMKREEEMAKAKQALERKKKLAEKAAAKAAVKAQKEAEKKLKDRERKAKKKAAASLPATDPEESTEAAAEVAEPEKPEETVEDPAQPKNKDRKENTIKYRSRTKGPELLPKVILKRKKSTNYWVWVAPAVLLVLALVLVGYNRMF